MLGPARYPEGWNGNDEWNREQSTRLVATGGGAWQNVAAISRAVFRPGKRASCNKMPCVNGSRLLVEFTGCLSLNLTQL